MLGISEKKRKRTAQREKGVDGERECRTRGQGGGVVACVSSSRPGVRVAPNCCTAVLICYCCGCVSFSSPQVVFRWAFSVSGLPCGFRWASFHFPDLCPVFFFVSHGHRFFSFHDHHFFWFSRSPAFNSSCSSFFQSKYSVFPRHSSPEVLFHTLRDVAFDPLQNDAVVIEFCMRLLPGIDVTYRFVTVCGFMRIFVYVCVRTFTYIFTDLDKAPVLHALPPKENVCPAFNGM